MCPENIIIVNPCWCVPFSSPSSSPNLLPNRVARVSSLHRAAPGQVAGNAHPCTAVSTSSRYRLVALYLITPKEDKRHSLIKWPWWWSDHIAGRRRNGRAISNGLRSFPFLWPSLGCPLQNQSSRRSFCRISVVPLS